MIALGCVIAYLMAGFVVTALMERFAMMDDDARTLCFLTWPVFMAFSALILLISLLSVLYGFISGRRFR